jgi:hypothetical protein
MMRPVKPLGRSRRQEPLTTMTATDRPVFPDAALPDAGLPPDRPVRRKNSRADAERTIQVSLRLPASQVTALRELAFAAGRREQCMITPQEIVRRMIADALRDIEAPPTA